jgi:hypothetical protein
MSPKQRQGMRGGPLDNHRPEPRQRRQKGMSLSFCPPIAECHYRPAAEPYELPTLALMTLSDHRTRQTVLLVTFRLVPDKILSLTV